MIEQRRTFLKTAAVGWVGFCGFQRRAFAGQPYANKTFEAFLEAVIPGSRSDPTKAPGAEEAGTIEFLTAMDVEKVFPVSIDLVCRILVKALDAVAYLRHLRPFCKLDLEKRARLVADLSLLPGMTLLLRLVRAPFYTAAVNRAGFDYLGYPGANHGYADFSFAQPISRPEPGSVCGNLP
ncbi:MAG: hypothetical protein HY074_01775 [Deltaproteobacteria bacterium]|nr:hypothetical protein [Deltaproteobacteria bacterium]